MSTFISGGPYELLIGGEWSQAAEGETFATLNPATTEELGRVAQASAEDVDRAVKAARTAFEGPWSRSSPAERGRLLHTLAELIEQNAAELAELEALDNGKPQHMAFRVDLPLAIEQLRYYAGWTSKLEGSVIPVSVKNMFVYTKLEPVGVCAQIVPWNFPLYNAVLKIAPALAAGNAVVLKPSEHTPLSAIRLGQLAQEAGIPAGVLNILTGDGRTGAALVDHPGVDKVAFTGSTEVGREIGAKAGRALKRVTLELGGKSASIVLRDADLEATARGAYFAMYFNTGQVCQAGSRLFVHESQHEEFVERVAESARSAVVGPGSAPGTEIGPLVSQEQYDKVLSYIEAGERGGAELMVDGRSPSVDGGWFVGPTLFTGVRDDMSIARDEIFGPVLSVMSYSDLDEVARRANDSDYGLAAYVWTRDAVNAHRVAGALKAGSVFVNTATVSDPAAPFGGYKSSGIGREGGRANLDAYLETKTVWLNLR